MGALGRREKCLRRTFIRLPYMLRMFPSGTGFFLTHIASTIGVCGCLIKRNVVMHGQGSVSLYNGYLHIAMNAQTRGTGLVKTLGGCR